MIKLGLVVTVLELQVLESFYDLRNLLLPYYQALRMKRTRADEDDDPPKMKPNLDRVISEAARFNNTVLRKLEKSYAVDPEDDLLARFPSGYSMRLADRIRKTQNQGQ